MAKTQKEQRDQNSVSMLDQKTNEDYNKQQPNPNDPNLRKSGSIKVKNEETFDKEMTETKSEKDTYTCTMHPEVNSEKPGKCPKCGMELIKKK